MLEQHDIIVLTLDKSSVTEGFIGFYENINNIPVIIVPKEVSIEYKELQTSGNKSLGGNDITIKIVDDIIEQVNEFFGLDLELDTDKKGLYRYFDRDLYDGMLSYGDYYSNIQNIKMP